jgi:hypothetical protein
MKSIKESVGTGRYIIEGIAICCGKDINISIGGGELYHIGAVGVAVPRTEIRNEKKRSATTSVICVQGHKEDEFAHYASKYLATALNCIVTVSVGVHIDDADMEDIKILNDNFKNLVKKLEKSLLEKLIED